MLRRTSFWMAAALSLGLLTACDTNKGSTQSALEPSVSSLVFASPAPGQEGVALRSPIFLRFSDPIASSFDVRTVQLFDTRTNMPVDVTASRPLASTSGNIDLIRLDPALPLSPNTTYVVRVNGAAGVLLNTPDGERVAALQTLDGTPLRFTTRAALRGSAQEMSRSVGFTVTQVTIPSLGLNNQASDPITRDYPLTDFSTIRMELSQPIESSTAIYGSTVRLVDNQNNTVDARLFVKGPRLTIDPVADLTPGVNYRVAFTTGLRSEFDRAYSGPLTFDLGSPLDTRVNTTGQTRQRTLIGFPSCRDATPCLSTLSGEVANQQAVQADVLGYGRQAPMPAIRATADGGTSLAGELGNLVGLSRFLQGANSESIPLRLFAGNQIALAPLSIRLVTANPAQGLLTSLGGNSSTGDLTITLINDATGVVVPNPYSRDPGAPAQVKLHLDLAVKAANGDADGAFTQNILHAEANGIARVDARTGKLMVETVGIIELKILDTDDAYALLSLKLESDLSGAAPTFNNQTATFRPTLAEGLRVTSWVPGPSVLGIVSGGEFLRPGDPLIVSLSDSVDPNIVNGPASASQATVQLTGGGNPPVSIRVDGNAVVVTPRTPLAYDTDYVLNLNGLRALGNPDVRLPPTSLAFSLPLRLMENGSTPARQGNLPRVRPPVVLRSYPGFPCTVVDEVTNRRCVGGVTTTGVTDNIGNAVPLDDVLPLATLEADRDLEWVFSQDMNLDSLSRIRVERVAGGTVAGTLTSVGRTVRFKPSAPWVIGTQYRWVMPSVAGDTACASSVCGANNQPLQTQLLAPTLAQGVQNRLGGPDLRVRFIAVAPRRNLAVGAETSLEGGTITRLQALPGSDVNANFIYEPTIPNVRAIGERLLRTVQGAECPAQALGTTFTQLADVTVDDGSNAAARSRGQRCFAPNALLIQPDTSSPDGSRGGVANYFAVGCSQGTQPDLNGNAPVSPTNPAFACQGNQHLHLTTALAARITGVSTVSAFTGAQGLFPTLPSGVSPTAAVSTVEIEPSWVNMSGPDLYASLALGGLPVDALVAIPPLNTGALFFRIRYNTDGSLPRGVLFNRVKPDGSTGLFIRTRLNLYFDAPEINAAAEILSALLGGTLALPIEHNIRSNVNLSDPARSTCRPGHTCSSQLLEGEVKFLPDGRLTIDLVNAFEPLRFRADLRGLLLGIPLDGYLNLIIPTNRLSLNLVLPPLKAPEPLRRVSRP